MPGEISWGVPRILKTVYGYRSEIIMAWKSVEEDVSRKKGRSIAFTGLSGIVPEHGHPCRNADTRKSTVCGFHDISRAYVTFPDGIMEP